MEKVNIVKLIEDNPVTTLSKFYQGNLLNKIKNNFDTEEQKMFIASFYCYLRLKNEDFIIDLDEIWKWLGFSQKIRAKELLQKHFKQDLEYKILLSSTREQKEENRGGKNKEIIMLTIKTFKKLCLKANTSKADQIHDYYIKLEEVLDQTIMEESSELREQLEQKDSELNESNKKIKGNEQRIKQLENRIISKQSRIKYKERNVIYMVQDEFHKRDRIYVLGKAIDLCERVNTYNKTRDHEVVYYKECNSAQQMALIEKCILYKLDNYREVSNRDRFILPENRNISLFTNVIDFFIDAFEDIDIDVDIEKDLTEKDLYKKDIDQDQDIDIDIDQDIHYDIEQEVKKEYIEEEAKIKMQEYKKEYRIKNLETIKEKNAEYREDHKEQKRITDAIYRENNKDKLIEKHKIYYDTNKEVILQKNKNYQKENKEEVAKQKKEYHDLNKDIINQNRKIYREENKDLIKEQKRIYREKYKDQIKEKDKKYREKKGEKITCECGITLKLLNSKTKKHINSQAHQNFINSQKK